MAKHYINQDYPVYISYAWENEHFPGIETDVNKLCKALEDNGIYYERDKKSGNPLCPYRYSINKTEEKIGEGSAVIMFISEKYIKSLHCMHEWRLIREKGDIMKRVFPVVLEDAELTQHDGKKYQKYYNDFVERRNKLIAKLQDPSLPDPTHTESEAIRYNGYIDDLKEMHRYLSDYNVRVPLKIIRNNNYSVIIEQLTEHLNNIVPKRKQEGKNTYFNKEINNGLKLWPLIVIAFLIVCGAIVWIFPFSSPSDVNNPTLQPTTEEETPLPETISDTQWITSESWPYGKWQGGVSLNMPDGAGVNVIYETTVRLNHENILDNPVGDLVAHKGDKIVDGCFHNGSFRYGTIIRADGTKEIINH